MFVDYGHFVISTEKHAGDWAFLEHGKVVEVKMEDLSMEEQKKAQVSFSSLDVHTEMTGFHPRFFSKADFVEELLFCTMIGLE